MQLETAVLCKGAAKPYLKSLLSWERTQSFCAQMFRKEAAWSSLLLQWVLPQYCIQGGQAVLVKDRESSPDVGPSRIGEGAPGTWLPPHLWQESQSQAKEERMASGLCSLLQETGLFGITGDVYSEESILLKKCIHNALWKNSKWKEKITKQLSTSKRTEKNSSCSYPLSQPLSDYKCANLQRGQWDLLTQEEKTSSKRDLPRRPSTLLPSLFKGQRCHMLS